MSQKGPLGLGKSTVEGGTGLGLSFQEAQGLSKKPKPDLQRVDVEQAVGLGIVESTTTRVVFGLGIQRTRRRP